MRNFHRDLGHQVACTTWIERSQHSEQDNIFVSLMQRSNKTQLAFFFTENLHNFTETNFILLSTSLSYSDISHLALDSFWCCNSPLLLLEHCTTLVFYLFIYFIYFQGQDRGYWSKHAPQLVQYVILVCNYDYIHVLNRPVFLSCHT